MKKIENYNRYLPNELETLKPVRLGPEYWVSAKQIASMQNNGGIETKPNTLLIDLDSKNNEYYETWLDVDNIGLEKDVRKNLRQFRYENNLVYWLIKDEGKYKPVEVPRMGKHIVLPEELYRHLRCPSARFIVTPKMIFEKINTTILVILGIVALFIAWLMMQGG